MAFANESGAGRTVQPFFGREQARHCLGPASGLLAGLAEGDMLPIGARPGQGKTVLGLQLLLDAIVCAPGMGGSARPQPAQGQRRPRSAASAQSVASSGPVAHGRKRRRKASSSTGGGSSAG